MSGTVVPFRPRLRALPQPAPSPGLILVEVSLAGFDVLLQTDDVEVELTPDQARELAVSLCALADQAEARRD